jgi:hypothetical protein
MPRVVFAPAIQRHVQTPPQVVVAGTIRDALNRVFESQPVLRDYIVDEQGALRKHVAIFIDDAQIPDRDNLDQRIGEQAEIYVVQALSGG